MDSHDKEVFIQNHLKRYPGSEENILSFIYDVTNYRGNSLSDIDFAAAIHEYYASGHCYYFAKMLQDAFGGDVMWLYKRSHIVFRSKAGICYDAYGVFDDYGENELRHLNELTDIPLSGFTKVGDYKVTAVECGDCTDTITWVLYENGTLCLCGHGELDAGQHLWCIFDQFHDSITHIQCSECITVLYSNILQELYRK